MQSYDLTFVFSKKRSSKSHDNFHVVEDQYNKSDPISSKEASAFISLYLYDVFYLSTFRLLHYVC